MSRELEIIQRRKAEVTEALAKIDRDKTALEQEASELAVTERTLARLLSVNLPEQEAVAVASSKGRKPQGIPSIYIMAVELLRDSGQEWMEAQDIIRLIRERWWPTADNNDVSPTLWRLYKTSKLRKDGTKYALLPEPVELRHGMPAGELLQNLAAQGPEPNKGLYSQRE